MHKSLLVFFLYVVLWLLCGRNRTLIVLVATVHIVAVTCPRQPAVAMACHIPALAAAAAARSPASAAGHSLASAAGRMPRPAWVATHIPEPAASHIRHKPVLASAIGRMPGLAWAAVRIPASATSRSLLAASHIDRKLMATKPCRTAAAAARAYHSLALAAARIRHKLKAVAIRVAAVQAELERARLERAGQVGPKPVGQAALAVKLGSATRGRSFEGLGRTCNR